MNSRTGTTRSSLLLALGVVAVTVGGMGCSDSPSSIQPRSEPQPGSASIAVTANPDGATGLVLRIAGGAVDDVRASGETIVYWEPDTSGAHAVVVLPGSASGGIASVQLPDIQALGRYSVTVVEAADGWNEPISTGSVSIELR